MAESATNKRVTVRRRAGRGEVLGATKPDVRIKSKWRRHYCRLVDLHACLMQRRGELVQAAQEEKPVFSLHMADAGTDNYDQDLALSMVSSEQDALYEIEQALHRIKTGAYGICELTGKPIEPQRLNAVPWTRFSAAAETELENQGAVQRTRFGRREEVSKTKAPPEEE